MTTPETSFPLSPEQLARHCCEYCPGPNPENVYCIPENCKCEAYERTVEQCKKLLESVVCHEPRIDDDFDDDCCLSCVYCSAEECGRSYWEPPDFDYYCLLNNKGVSDAYDVCKGRYFKEIVEDEKDGV